MIKVLTTHKIEKKHDNKHQQDQLVEKVARVSAFKSKLSFDCNYQYNDFIGFGFYPVVNEMNRNEMDPVEPKKGVISEK